MRKLSLLILLLLWLCSGCSLLVEHGQGAGSILLHGVFGDMTGFADLPQSTPAPSSTTPPSLEEVSDDQKIASVLLKNPSWGDLRDGMCEVNTTELFIKVYLSEAVAEVVSGENKNSGYQGVLGDVEVTLPALRKVTGEDESGKITYTVSTPLLAGLPLKVYRAVDGAGNLIYVAYGDAYLTTRSGHQDWVAGKIKYADLTKDIIRQGWFSVSFHSDCLEIDSFNDPFESAG